MMFLSYEYGIILAISTVKTHYYYRNRHRESLLFLKRVNIEIKNNLVWKKAIKGYRIDGVISGEESNLINLVKVLCRDRGVLKVRE